MKRAPLASSFALALAACSAQNHASVEFAALCAPPDPAPGCVYPATCDLFWGIGRVFADVALVNEVVWPIQINNQLPNNENLAIGRVNTNDAVIEELRLSYQSAALGATIPDATITQTFVIPADGASSPILILVPPATATLLSAALPAGTTEVLVEVRAAGRFANGETFETGPFQVPLDLCAGCFVVPGCPAGEFLYACPQIGQSGSYDCLTP